MEIKACIIKNISDILEEEAGLPWRLSRNLFVDTSLQPLYDL